MSKKNIIVLILVVLAAVAYWLISSYSLPVVPGEQSLSDAEYLLDDSVLNDVADAINDVLLSGSLDSEALAAEASQLDSLPDTSFLDEADQVLSEVSQ